MLFSHHNGEKTVVFLRVRLQMLLFECVLLCFSSHMCKKHYKTNQKSCFLHIGSPNPLFYRCKCLAMFISLLNCFKPFVLRRFEKGLARSAAGWPWNRFTLWVCFCVFPSLNGTENPIRSETSVREWIKIQMFLINSFLGPVRGELFRSPPVSLTVFGTDLSSKPAPGGYPMAGPGLVFAN